MILPALSIETATANKDNAASIALKTTETEALRILEKPNSQAAELVPQIEVLLKDHALDYNDLKSLYITVGPGSFTGIRIGLSVARAIAFSCPNLHLVPITTLEALAAKANYGSEKLCVFHAAGKGELYTQTFHKVSSLWHTEGEISLIPAEKMTDSAEMFGNGALGQTNIINALSLFKAAETVDIGKRDAVPLYIRPPDAKPQQNLALSS